jgi:hypothetical protein
MACSHICVIASSAGDIADYFIFDSAVASLVVLAQIINLIQTAS